MLLKFTIASAKRTKREYTYQNFSFSGGFSKDKKGIEYTVELAAADGERYFIFHQPKADATMRQYRVMYVDARKMVSADGTKYSPEQEGAYNVKRIYTKDEFDRELNAQRERLVSRQHSDAEELQRIASLTLA
jgi:hypothetical protein